MPIFPARFRHERGEGILPRAENHSSAEMGMSGDVHLFVDEASGAHSPNLEKAARAVWCGDRKSTRLNSSHSQNLVCRLLLEKKKQTQPRAPYPSLCFPLIYHNNFLHDWLERCIV